VLRPFLIPWGARMGNWLGKRTPVGDGVDAVWRTPGTSGWRLLEVSGRQPDEGVRAHGWLGMRLGREGRVGCMARFLLNTLLEGDTLRTAG
jgi:hypothetical protein